LTEQVKQDHLQLLVGLSSERDARKKQYAATRRALRAVRRNLDRIEASQDKTDDLLIAYVTQTEHRFQELTTMFGEAFPELAWREELEAIKARLDRLENPPAA
jgi:hypothetical protein